MKKYLSFIIAVVLFCGIVSSVSAEEPGETITLPISVSAISEALYALQVDFEFDPELEFVSSSVVAPSGYIVLATPSAGRPVLAIGNLSYDTPLPEGVVCNVTFNIRENIPSGTYGITITYYEAINEKVQVTYDLAVVGGSVDVKSDICPPHTWDSGVVTVEANCNATGVMKYTCTICKSTKNETIPVTEHVEGIGIEETVATCTTDGVMIFPCAICGEVLREEQIVAFGHAEGDRVIATEPTCSTNGAAFIQCSNCGKTVRTEEIPATGIHSEVVDKAVEATCTVTGLTAGKHCERCGTVLVAQTEVPALGHSYSEKVTTEPTCTAEGVKTFTCSKCSHSYTESIVALGHKEVKDAAVAATCTTIGLTEGKHCERCSTILVAQQNVPALGHNYSDKVTIEPTCTAEGVKSFTCTKCSHSYTESIAALGHKEVKDEAKAPTCTVAGLTEGSHCERCGIVLVTQTEIVMLGHRESEKVVVTEPSATMPGAAMISCKICGELIRMEEIPPLGDSRVPGDANEDGYVDIFDALAILQYAVDWEVVIDLSNADVNADGLVDIFDALLILQYAVGWEVELL